MLKGYLGTRDIEEAYIKVKGTRDGISSFRKAAEAIASRTDTGAFIYKDELALYSVFEQFLAVELKQCGIDCFGRLMQYVS